METINNICAVSVVGNNLETDINIRICCLFL